MKVLNLLSTSITRRSFLSTTLVGTGYMTATMARVAPVAAAARTDKYQGLKSDQFLAKVSSLSRVEDEMVFTEGPATDRSGDLYFTNVPVSRILKWDPKKRELSVFRENSNKANGLYFDPRGRLLACEGGLGRVTRTDMKTGKVEVLATEFNGFPFAPSNDLCLDA
ncbi:MAG: SMP-30/gluconolactonase/LRE family protein, partial [Pirellulaceae bacterium]|nr:SMP-30/gluconolactonase/LRE family protein [Pirellulaceae bacterium]